jgi:hypothetical protein
MRSVSQNPIVAIALSFNYDQCERRGVLEQYANLRGAIRKDKDVALLVSNLALL